MPRPSRSKCLPITLWPPMDRAAWVTAICPGDPFECRGIAVSWSTATRRKTIAGYGRFLFWLKERNELDETAAPAARITRERLVAYLEDLTIINRGHTIQCRMQELGDAIQALAPEDDWRFIKRAAGRLRATTRGCLPPIVEVIESPDDSSFRVEYRSFAAWTGSSLSRWSSLVIFGLQSAATTQSFVSTHRPPSNNERSKAFARYQRGGDQNATTH